MLLYSPMKFGTLQENLRKALWKRIEDGELTGYVSRNRPVSNKRTSRTF